MWQVWETMEEGDENREKYRESIDDLEAALREA